jgi:hypothetical protein
MRWVYYRAAVVATAFACLLWLVVIGAWTSARSVPLPAPVGRIAPPGVLVVPLGCLPVPPKLRPVGAVCVGGRFVRERGTEEGYAYDIEVRVDGKVVPCR